MSRTRDDLAYYMTFRDDWSAVTWLHLLRKKNQAFDVFKAFKANIKRFSDAKIITLREDNDGEYIDQKFQDYLAAEDINWNPRAPYVPEQNNEAERLNRALMYKIRSMLNQTKISRRMWKELIKTIA